MTDPTDTPNWRALRGAALTDAILTARWYVNADDVIGGWCVTVVDLPPSHGYPSVADFLDRETADHIATLHNNHLDGRTPA